jgi:hypothetical protein
MRIQPVVQLVRIADEGEWPSYMFAHYPANVESDNRECQRAACAMAVPPVLGSPTSL